MAQLNLTSDEFILLRDLINENCGILLGDEKDYLIESRLSQLAIQSGCQTFNEFYFKAKNDSKSGLRDKMVDAMTTNETYWFRDKYPYQVMDEIIFPELTRLVTKKKKSKIRIWSAACSTGQEPYSAAMTVKRFCSRDPFAKEEMFEILATDISPSALYLAINGKYDNIAITRGLPAEMNELYFTSKGRIFILDEGIKNMVTFKKFNLQDNFISLPKFDIVLCRYVAIYFSDSLKRELFYKISNLLDTPGYLFLGATESINNYSGNYDNLKYAKSYYYRMRSQS